MEKKTIVGIVLLSTISNLMLASCISFFYTVKQNKMIDGLKIIDINSKEVLFDLKSSIKKAIESSESHLSIALRDIKDLILDMNKSLENTNMSIEEMKIKLKEMDKKLHDIEHNSSGTIYIKNEYVLDTGSNNKKIILDIPTNIIESVERKKDYNKSASLMITRSTVLPENYKEYIYSYESVNDTTKLSPSKKHAGICQMGDSALHDVGYNGNHWKFLKEPYGIQDKYCTKFFNISKKALRNNGVPITLLNIYVLHQQGATAGMLILKDKKKAYKLYSSKIVNNINYNDLIDFYLKYTENKLITSIKKVH